MNILRLLRRCHLPLLLLLSLCQPLTLMLCWPSPQASARLALLPVLLMLMLLLCAAAPGRLRPAVFAACCIALLGANRLLLSHRAATYTMPVCCAVILFYALSHVNTSPSDASPVFYFICAAAQLVALFLLHRADAATRNAPAIQGVLCLCLLLMLLAFNRISLNSASLARYHLSDGMAQTGAVLTVCVFALALLLCALPAVASGFVWLWRTLRDAGIWLLLLVSKLLPAQSTGGAGGAAMPLLPIGTGQENAAPSLLTVILTRIASLFSMIILIAGSVLLLWLLVRALVRLVHQLLLRLQRCAAAATQDYEDEITDTRGPDGERAFLPLRRRAKQRQVYPDTPAGRIRRRYAQLRARHSAWADSSTARENLAADTAALYERARYSEHAPSEHDAQRFEQETR